MLLDGRRGIHRIGNATNNVVEDDQEGELDEHREAAASRVHFLLLVEAHQLFVQLCPVLRPLVLLLEFLDLRLDSLHGDHGFRALHGQRGKRPHDQDGENGDSQGVVGDHRVDERQDGGEEMQDWLEDGANRTDDVAE